MAAELGRSGLNPSLGLEIIECRLFHWAHLRAEYCRSEHVSPLVDCDLLGLALVELAANHLSVIVGGSLAGLK